MFVTIRGRICLVNFLANVLGSLVSIELTRVYQERQDILS